MPSRGTGLLKVLTLLDLRERELRGVEAPDRRALLLGQEGAVAIEADARG